MFHVSEGLYFERGPNGQVHITKREDGRDEAPIIFEATIPKDCWVSVMAHMSSIDNHSLMHQLAEIIHS